MRHATIKPIHMLLAMVVMLAASIVSVLSTPIPSPPITLVALRLLLYFPQGQDGELYSTIQTNGTHNLGSVYKMTTAGEYTLVYSFCAELGHCNVTGDSPYGGVTLGTDGNLYGTALGGGACDQGVGQSSGSLPLQLGQSCGTFRRHNLQWAYCTEG